MIVPDKRGTISTQSPALGSFGLPALHLLSHLVWGEKSKSLLQTGNGRLSSILSVACLLQPTCPSCRSSCGLLIFQQPAPQSHSTEPVAVIFIIIPPKTKCSLEEALSLTNRPQLGARVGPSEGRGPVGCQRGLGLKP